MKTLAFNELISKRINTYVSNISFSCDFCKILREMFLINNYGVLLSQEQYYT